MHFSVARLKCFLCIKHIFHVSELPSFSKSIFMQPEIFYYQNMYLTLVKLYLKIQIHFCFKFVSQQNPEDMEDILTHSKFIFTLCLS